jgi:hypothetical protein
VTAATSASRAAQRGTQVLGQQGSVSGTGAGSTTEAEAEYNELLSATETLRLSKKVADSFTFPGLTARRKLERVPVDGKFWFSKIYEIITYEEISARHLRKFPSFMLHFIPIFYDLYYQALQSRLQKQPQGVSDLWDAHFTVTEKELNTNVIVEYLDHITNCVVSGVKAHILGDMATALEKSYRSYVTRYPAAGLRFDDLRSDYFEVDPEVFRNVPPSFFAYLSKLALPFPSVVLGQYLFGAGNDLIRGLPIETIVEWRSEVWKRAREALRN